MNNNIHETNSNRKKELIDYFYDILIKLRPNIFIDVLKGYSNLQGNSVTEDMVCYFANEIPKEEEDYFGDTGIEYCFFFPSVEHDTIVILSDSEFYEFLQEKVKLYIANHTEFEKEIFQLLSEIKQKLHIH